MERTIEITGIGKTLTKLGKLRKIGLGRRVAKELAQRLVEETKSRAPYWRGDLMKSIQSRQTNVGYNITMLDYGAKLETGFQLTEVTPILKEWAFDTENKLETPQSFLNVVATKGHYVQPRFFISGSINKIISDFDNIASFEVKNVIKEAGL